MVIVLKRQRIGSVVQLDSETLKSVSIRTEPNILRDIVGNVTRYNILSGIGRFYDDDHGHTVSFKMADNASSSQKRKITWSLHHAQEEGEGKIKMDVQRAVSAKGVIRRYLVQKVSVAK
jgi:hypothetical protein